MKGVILAGGTGSRLRPITHTGPKQLIPVGNKPVIEHAIEDLKDAGITDIGVVLGTKGQDEIQSYLGSGDDFGVDITYIVQGEPLGLAHAVGCARNFVDGEAFVVYLGDNMMHEGISGLVEGFDPAEHAASVGLQEVDDPTRYGIVDLNDDGEVERLVEKPDQPPSNLALIGVYVVTSSIFEQIEHLEPSWRGEYEITEAFQKLLDEGYDVLSHTVSGWWKDTGKPGDILHANRLVLDDLTHDVSGTIDEDADVMGRVELGDGSTIESGAVVRGPVSIGSDTTLGPGAYIGPYTSIGDGCAIERVHLESSIVVGESDIDCDNRIIDSVIGRKATITSEDDIKPVGDRLVIGENSSIVI